MTGHDLVVIGASAGGVEALLPIVRRLPAGFPAAVCVVIHVPPNVTSQLPRLLAHAGALAAEHARDGQLLECGHIYVAPPDLHLLVKRGHLCVSRGPRENRVRPAVDPLFRTAARAYGPRVVGVILSGALSDGTAGLMAIKRRGGLAVVQRPETALVSMMPASALEYVEVDHCVPATEIAPLLVRLVAEPAPEEGGLPVPPEMEFEATNAEWEQTRIETTDPPGKLTGLVCPDCRGPLWEIQDGDLIRYRCREGHALTGDSVLDGQTETVEQALWIALETLTESALMARRLAEQAATRGHQHVARHFEERARQTHERAKIIRRVLEHGSLTLPDPSR